MGKKIVALMVFIILVLSNMTGCQSEKEVKLFNEDDGLVVQGMIEAKEVSINSKIPGKIFKIYVEEGAEVNVEGLLIEMDSDEIKAKEKQALGVITAAKSAHDAANGQVKAAQSSLEKAENGAREQEIAQTQAAYDFLEKTYQRIENLYENGAVPENKKDEVAMKLEVAKQKLNMAKEGARSEDKSAAQALVVQAIAMENASNGKFEQAQGALEEVRVYLKDTKILSPINGTVTMLNVEEGELVSTGMSIATVTNLDHPWVELNVSEIDLAQVKLGQKVNVKIPAYSKDLFEGKVVRISKKPDFATKRATNDNGDFDIVSFGVKVEIDNKDQILIPGMTAFVQFVN